MDNNEVFKNILRTFFGLNLEMFRTFQVFIEVLIKKTCSQFCQKMFAFLPSLRICLCYTQILINLSLYMLINVMLIKKREYRIRQS